MALAGAARCSHCTRVEALCSFCCLCYQSCSCRARRKKSVDAPGAARRVARAGAAIILISLLQYRLKGG